MKRCRIETYGRLDAVALMRRMNRAMKADSIGQSSHPPGRAVGQRTALESIATLADCSIR